MKDLAGKRIVVAGGATGMGAELVVRLTEIGAKVIVGYHNKAAMEGLLPELQGHQGTAIPMFYDQADDASIAALVQRCIDEFSGIDGLAITAADTSAATMEADDTVLKMDPEVWRHTFRINVIGHGLLMKAAIPHMIENGGGSIVVISSEAAFTGIDFVPAYSSSKAALSALVRHTARLCGPDKIRVNGICPGRVVDHRNAALSDTRPEVVGLAPSNALRRDGRPEDVAKIMGFLLSEESGWITGQIISANGGGAMRD